MNLQTFLLALAINFFTQGVPIAICIYFAIRFALTHGAFKKFLKASGGE